MSKFVSDIIRDIKANPNTWVVINRSDIKSEEFHICGPGLTNGKVRIINYGNPRFAAVESVYIDGGEIPTSYIDRWRLHVTINRWFKTIRLSHLQKDVTDFVKCPECNKAYNPKSFVGGCPVCTQLKRFGNIDPNYCDKCYRYIGEGKVCIECNTQFTTLNRK